MNKARDSMKCKRCNKEFTSTKDRTYCSLKCYRNRSRIDWGQVAFDALQFIMPIMVLAFAIFCLTPRQIVMVEDDKIELIKDIPSSSCEEFDFIMDDEEEDLKFRDWIRTKR